MAQIAIPIVIAGVLYLISNDRNKHRCKENFEIDSSGQYVYDTEQHKDSEKNGSFKYSTSKTVLNVNNTGTYSQYQDKFNTPKIKTTDFTSLTGEKLTNINHNNMNVFYNNKSNGEYSQSQFNNIESRLDNYTGMGSNNIEKSEIASLFRPQDHTQNVFGAQNQSDFMQSRVNESLRHANTKPWQETREAPGTLGFNTAVENRDKWMPKKVNELRVETNPKSNYEQNYVAPAFKMGDRAQIGKMIQKSPEKYHMNGTNAMGVPLGNLAPTQMSEQMLTDEHREHTSVSYYGARNVDSAGYVKGAYQDPHKTQLPANPYLNLTSNQVFPTNEMNYSKGAYKSYNNNRDASGEYFGAVGGLFMANVVNPIVNGLKHTKKSNITENPNQTGYFTGNKRHTLTNDIAPAPTNRQMQEDRIGMNHLQVNRQNGDGYINSNPYLIGQQRDSTSFSTTGIARGLPETRSYQAEYNQRVYEKPSENRIASGNTNVFNNVMNVNITKSEQCNDRTQNIYIPTFPNTSQLGTNTTQKQEYKNLSDEYLQADMLKAFKQNPYTKPIGSVA
jgi:hypothetical protein